MKNVFLTIVALVALVCLAGPAQAQHHNRHTVHGHSQAFSFGHGHGYHHGQAFRYVTPIVVEQVVVPQAYTAPAVNAETLRLITELEKLKAQIQAYQAPQAYTAPQVYASPAPQAYTVPQAIVSQPGYAQVQGVYSVPQTLVLPQNVQHVEYARDHTGRLIVVERVRQVQQHGHQVEQIKTLPQVHEKTTVKGPLRSRTTEKTTPGK